jgi:Aspartyl protease
MAKRKEIVYNSPSDWLKNNRKALGAFAGEWIAFTNSGVIIHNKSGRIVAQEARKTKLDYSLKYVHPLEIPRIVRILPIRIRSLKNNKWQPDYPIELSTSKITEKLTILVDSGADITVIPKWTGEDLGLKVDENDYIEKAEGVNGTVDYIIKNLTFNIDGHTFKAPVGWVQTEEVEDILLGREVIFDLFDIEFKQAEETIIFKKRKDTTI